MNKKVILGAGAVVCLAIGAILGSVTKDGNYTVPIAIPVAMYACLIMLLHLD